MAILNIEKPYTNKYAFLQLGFRPFFAGAMAYSALSILLWALMYFGIWQSLDQRYATTMWHAHEMIFGFAMAVVAGFLLTAIKNWTNIQTLQNQSLLALFVFWMLARLLPLTGQGMTLLLAAISDMLFVALLVYATLTPLIRAKQWMQIGIVSKLVLISACNFVFYFGLFSENYSYQRIAIYVALYLLLALILTMIRRLIPFFVEKGIDQPFQAKNNKWIDFASLVTFVIFAIWDIVNPMSQVVALLCVIQFFLHCYRISGWYHPEVWKKPLLWVLMTAYAWITLGFLLKALSIWVGVSPYAALHSFAYGGIGMITLGMMTRVSLGHTGRNVFDPPGILTTVFVLLNLGAVFRIILPPLASGMYSYWIAASQILWVLAFSIVLLVYLPMLIKARVDRRPG